MEWAKKKGYICSNEATEIAAFNGHIHILQYLKKENNLAHNVVHSAAIKGNRRDVLEWLDKNGVLYYSLLLLPCYSSSFYTPTRITRLNVVKYKCFGANT